MITLGVDPGLSLTGWGVVNRAANGSLALIEYGCIKTKPDRPLADRLEIINSSLCEIIAKHAPQEMAIEELFFSKEARTVAAVCQARGVILLAAAKAKIPVIEYNPRHVKISMTGYGSADKNQIQQMVKAFLKLKEIPKPDDAADAVAIAICHLTTVKISPALRRM
ncbi:MAG TPA: crossover junction endodeoxyribonuclease RuvC [Elusimicrobia bacterium]|nr:MAG: crossover junction endodeoxyribonuclease RuvC [Elusimicrobia bacterium RIFOXYA12_FULL_49_49]OGS09848.1 MAG: crossover junction endodeoxyribonuclease RuvC [Elusimicrobia bacterium RIFOXYB1_FULL_48_9]OGS15470.1 MAG: crossover junction endodeoxyribonuclease RuvC [Elusimicrobia bacterium RIFOXYA2_FULL_47_53]OGS26965.1 MAG: crossover junction endodeoxyribonuclease RuvC [Elusimicrobia bacterium RIFOXYB12_FULL_50_12]OGS30910.1 MAG: crossover junction endodeoxyribonuclease RuvC [Elusimicrobia b